MKHEQCDHRDGKTWYCAECDRDICTTCELVMGELILCRWCADAIALEMYNHTLRSKNPRTNPNAWDEKRDQFVAAALTAVAQRDEDLSWAISYGVKIAIELYGPRPGGDDDTKEEE